MHRESIAFHIFRILFKGLFLSFIGIIYWSSLLLEKDMKALKKDISFIKERISRIGTDISGEKISAKNILPEGENALAISRKYPLQENDSSPKKRHRLRKDLPNLLNEDKFYTKTLPETLGESFSPQGSLRMASIGRPENLHPFNGFKSVSSMVNLCSASVANMEFGKFETMAQGIAFKIEERPSPKRDSTEYWIHLRDNVYWHPLEQKHFPEEVILSPHFLKKHKVVSQDFKFYLDALMNSNVQLPGAVSLRNYLGDIEELTIVDDLTFIVRWKTQERNEEKKIKYNAKRLTGELQPLARFIYQYFPDGNKIIEDDKDPNVYRQNSIWAQNFSEHWAKNIIPSCGAWIFDSINEQRACFKRNPDFYNPYAALCEKLEIAFKETAESIWQDFKSGKIDFYNLSPKQTIELEEFMQSEEYQEQLKQGLGVHRVDYISRSYNYIGWNQNTPWFNSPKIRRAMTMAIDRKRIIRQNLNNMGVKITGPFSPHSPSYNKNIEPWPYDPDESLQILEEDGWYDSNGDGFLNKEINGISIPFAFDLVYYVKNPITKVNCEYIATTLKEIGIKCELKGVDIADLSNAFDEKSFDAIYLGWSLGSPPEEPKQLWHSSGANKKGSSNAIGFSNKKADEIIENLQYEYDIEKRRAMYREFHSIINEESPYTFLYAPKTTLLYRSYVQNVFIPSERQDLIPGANVSEPDKSLFWIKPHNENR